MGDELHMAATEKDAKRRRAFLSDRLTNRLHSPDRACRPPLTGTSNSAKDVVTGMVVFPLRP